MGANRWMLLLGAWCAVCADARGAEPLAGLSIAMLHVERGRVMALPMPTDRVADQTAAQNPDRTRAVFDQTVADCRQQQKASEEAAILCPVPAQAVARFHGMAQAPAQWRDAKGRVYRTRGGWHFRSDPGEGTGFGLEPSVGRTSVAVSGMALASGSDAVFVALRKVPASRWRRWPELTAQIAVWHRSVVSICGEHKQWCVHAGKAPPRATQLTGRAVEYALPDGRVLQRLRAAGPPAAQGKSEAASTYASIDFWRIVDRSGGVRYLGDTSGTEAAQTSYVNCETQCRHDWDRLPQVLVARGRTFLVGASSGGTVTDYSIHELVGGELRVRGGYQWGS
jgi:hypothetical protein